jgi:hypothetical protein
MTATSAAVPIMTIPNKFDFGAVFLALGYNALCLIQFIPNAAPSDGHAGKRFNRPSYGRSGGRSSKAEHSRQE